MFENLKKALVAELETRKENTRFFIVEGYYPNWAPQHRNNLDEGLRRWSTPTKWAAYQAGTLPRNQACVIATRRAFRDLEKTYAAKLAQLDRVAAAPDLDRAYINMDWVKSRTWGNNPRVVLITDEPCNFIGRASGYGYDKASAAIADALNASDAMLKTLYLAAENALAEGKTPIRSNDTTVTWREILGYGSGYSVLPYFEGGCGVSCFETIFRNCGFAFRMIGTAVNFDAYMITRKDVNA